MMADRRKMWRTVIYFSAFFALVACKKGNKPTVLNEDNWQDILEGEWLVKFYAPWCPACKALAPTWDQVATWSDDLNIKVAKIDVTENPGLSGRFVVTALPTIYHVKDGVFRQYRGSRQEESIVSYVDDKLWQQTDPVSWWVSPTSPQMAALSMFFKLSMFIRNVHTSMTESYGIPVWGSYALFAVATIVIGLLLGFVIVFLCDVVFPSKPQQQLPPHYTAVPGQRAPGTVPSHVDDDDADESDIVDDTNDGEVANSDSTTRRRRPQPTAD